MAAPGMGITGSRVGIGDNFAKARLLLAKRAGYLPNDQQINQQNPQGQWKAISSNLAADSRKAGFPNPMAFLRQGALTGGTAAPGRTRPGNMGYNPQGSLAYAPAQQAMAAPQQSTVRPLPQLPTPAVGAAAPMPIPVTGAPVGAGMGIQAALAARMAALQNALLPTGRGEVIA